MKAVILDIETIPDKTVWDGAPEENGAPTNGPPKPRGRGRPKAAPFPPMHAHQVIVAGFVAFDGEECAGVGHVEASTKDEEKSLLGDLADFMSSYEQIVSWRGRHFDIPVISLRSLHHGVPQPWIDAECLKKYGDRHVDMWDKVTDYGTIGIKDYNLDNFSQLVGMPGKGDFDGSLVAMAFQAGKMDTITEYCKRDVVQTAAVWLRWRLLRGMLKPEGYRTAIQSLLVQARQHEGMKAEQFKVNGPLLEAI